MTTLREYQSRIVHEAHGSDSIVVLPTGSGKTLIAAETIRRHLNKCPTSRALFIVPTVLLVNQSTEALKGHIPNVSVASHYGGRAAPYRYSILVSTPAAFSALAEANPLMYGLPTFGVIVFDEVHHVVKSHPYRAIARSLQLTTPELRPKVLGLTASLTYEMGEDAIVIAVQNLFAELGVTKVLTATDDELRKGGYHALRTIVEVPVPSGDPSRPSSSSSLGYREAKDSDNRNLFASSSSSFLVGAESVMNAGQPKGQVEVALQRVNEGCADISLDQLSSLALPNRSHDTLADFLEALENENPFLHPLSSQLMLTLSMLEAQIKEADRNFSSPIGPAGLGMRSSEWGGYAKRKALLCSTEPLHTWFVALEHFYEATRIIVNSRQTSLELSMRYLEMVGVLQPAMPVAVGVAAGRGCDLTGDIQGEGNNENEDENLEAFDDLYSCCRSNLLPRYSSESRGNSEKTSFAGDRGAGLNKLTKKRSRGELDVDDIDLEPEGDFNEEIGEFCPDKRPTATSRQQQPQQQSKLSMSNIPTQQLLTELQRPSPEHLKSIHGLKEMQSEWKQFCWELCRVQRLKETLTIQRKRYGEALRCIIFAQQRITTHILQYCLSSDPLFSDLNVEVIYSDGSPASASFRVRPTDLKERLQKFGSGEINILIATSVAEEGMDIPKANCVIRFDPVQTSVSLVQSRGRAREGGSSFVVLEETAKRSVQSLLDAELKQAELLRDSQKVMSLVKEGTERRNIVLNSRRCSAAEHLRNHINSGCNEKVVLNEFVQKAKGKLEEKYEMSKSAWGVQKFKCELSYVSAERDPPLWAASAQFYPTKKDAFKDAGKQLLEILRQVYC